MSGVDMRTGAALLVEGLRTKTGGREILKGVDFTLSGSMAVGIVGESGSGKTMFARALMGLLPPGSEAVGVYLIGGVPFDPEAHERDWRRIRGSAIGMILQDPFTALDPLERCGAQILAGVQPGRRKSFDIEAALAEVDLPASVAGRFPFELSGGQRQRVVIAAALATEPGILISDESTTALDVVTQQEILDLLDRIRVQRGMPLILITHDIGIVRSRTEHMFVLRDGEVVEHGATRDVIEHPENEYTKLLLAAAGSIVDDSFPAQVAGDPLLRVSGLTKRFGDAEAVAGANIIVNRGECVGIVGESGSGKTTLARCVVGLERPDDGRVEYLGASGKHPQIVFQDPYSSLNPAHTVRYALTEAMGGRRDGSESSSADLEELLALAELPKELLDRKPARLSGGQRQRVAIARALASDPELLVLDESVSALDAATRGQILATLERLREEKGLAMLFITHDLSVVRTLASRVYVMNRAHIVEEGTVEEVFGAPKDPYTQKLLTAALAV